MILFNIVKTNSCFYQMQVIYFFLFGSEKTPIIAIFVTELT